MPRTPALYHPFALALCLSLIVTLALAWTSGSRSSADPGRGERAARVAGTHAYGKTYRGQWFGSWRVHGRDGFCIEFDQGHPNSDDLVPAPATLPRYSAETSKRLKWIVSTYAGNHDAEVNASVAIAVWKLQNIKRFNTYYAKMVKARAIPRSVQQRAAAIYAASADHGPYALSMVLAKGSAGQVLAGTVTVRAANHKLLGGRALTFTGANSTIVSKAARTDARGVLRFRYRIAAPGTARVTADLVTPTVTGMYLSTPSSSAQRLLLAGGGTNAARTARSVTNVPTTRVANLCSGACDGNAQVSFTMANAVGASPVRSLVYADGKLVGSFVVPGGRTVTAPFMIADTSKVTTKVCLAGAAKYSCKSTPVATGGTTTVNCPPMVTYSYQGTCPCGGPRSVTYTVTAPTTTRQYDLKLVVDGATQRFTLVGGRTHTFDLVKVAKGSKVELSATVLGQTYVLDSSG